MWGVNVDCRDKWFRYLDDRDAFPIVSDEGDTVAQVFAGNNLYIHHDVCDEATFRELKIYRKILEEAVKIAKLSAEERSKKKEELARIAREKSKEQYVIECNRRFEKTVSGTRQKIESGQAEIQLLQKLLVKKIRETSGAKKKLEQLESRKDDEIERYGNEFEQLMNLEGYENFETHDGVIKGFTEWIYITPEECNPKNKTFSIGKFRIEVYTSGANGGIRFFNISSKGTGNSYNQHHPHVSSDGSACLGNIEEMVSELIGEYEYAALFQLAYQYLMTVNVLDSAGEGIFKFWPVVESEGQEKEQEKGQEKEEE